MQLPRVKTLELTIKIQFEREGQHDATQACVLTFHPVPVGHKCSWCPELGGLVNEGQGTLSWILERGDPLIRQSQPCDDWPSPLST